MKGLLFKRWERCLCDWNGPVASPLIHSWLSAGLFYVPGCETGLGARVKKRATRRYRSSPHASPRRSISAALHNSQFLTRALLPLIRMDLPRRACSTLCTLPPPVLLFIFVSLSARIYSSDTVIWTLVLVEWRQVQLEFPLVIRRIAGRPRILIKAPNGRCTVGPPFGFMCLPRCIVSSEKKS